MRRSSVLLISLLVLGLFLSPASAQPSPQLSISMMNLKPAGGITEDQCVLLTDRLLSEFVRTSRFNVVERSRRDEILKEQAFQLSGTCDEATCLVKVGGYLGVQKMVAGTVGKAGATYSVNLRMVDVESGRIEHTALKDYPGTVDYLLTTGMWEVAWQLAFAGLSDKEREAYMPVYQNQVAKRVVDSLAVVQREKEALAKEQSKRSGKRRLGFVTLGLGLMAGVGAGFEYMAGNSNFDKYNSATDVATMNDYKKKTRSADMAATLLYVTSGLFIGTSGLFFWSSRSGGKATGELHRSGLYLGCAEGHKPAVAYIRRF